jgi:inhibitor of cysteine peptidase
MRTRRWTQVGAGAVICIVIVALVAMVTSGCGSASASNGPLKLTQADSGKAFGVKTGGTIEVAIAGNPTTGYGWVADLSDDDAAVLELVGEPVYAPETTDEAIAGSGGVYTFTFKAKAAGQATLRLVYERSFEDVEPIQTFEVAVTVD